MVFSSTVFLFIFLPIVFIINTLLPVRFRNGFLLAASLFFYAWGEPVFVLIMLFSILINYLLALRIAGSDGQKSGKRYLVMSIAFNLLLLVAFKYTNFLAENISALTGIPVRIAPIPLPIGISFFTFQGMSYVMDVYKDRAKMQKKLLHAALYISFFPQLIAGPIVKYHDIAQQLEMRTETVEKVAMGIRRFAVGLGKKLLIANTAGQIADAVFAMDAAGLSTVEAWIGALAYTLQIYFDFSGYSDMAIGLGRMFGFEIMENFNYPYVAGSIKGFWRRWHISLTNWFREYLYFPLGGNRKGLRRTCFNTLVVFLLTGFWHGAEWTFILWGVFHGIFMILEVSGIIKPERFKVKALGNIYTMAVVTVGFTLFRSESIGQALAYLKAMFVKFSPGIQDAILRGRLLSPWMLTMLAAGVVASTSVVPYIKSKAAGSIRLFKVLDAAGYLSAFILLLLCVLVLSASTYNPFIYFRF